MAGKGLLLKVAAAHGFGMTAVHFTGEAGQLAEIERLIGLS